VTALSKVTSCRAAKGEARTWPARERRSMRLPGRGAVPCRRMHEMEGHGSWWASQSSKLPTDLTVRGGFDSHSPPPRLALFIKGFRKFAQIVSILYQSLPRSPANLIIDVAANFSSQANVARVAARLCQTVAGEGIG